MRSHLVAYVLMLVLFSPFLALPVAAQTATGQQDQVSQANRFLSAEVQRQIRDMRDEVTEDLRGYQDENFRALDSRMVSLMADLRWQVILAAAGAMFVAGAIVTLIIMRTMRTYSYKSAIEKDVDGASPAGAQADGQSFEQMQQRQWNMQPHPKGMGVEYGQQFASQNTDMNKWQAQPAYDGAWRSPVQTQKETGFDQRYPQPQPQPWEGQQWSSYDQQQQDGWQDEWYDDEYQGEMQ